MSGYIPEDKIEEIKSRTDIVTLVSEYLALRKVGRNFQGLCPFHQEKTPSFTVSPEKQIFYCFGCGAGGHVFAFLMKINGMTFPEAVRHLAAKIGVDLPEQDRHKSHAQEGLREQIIQINRVAAEFFAKALHSPAGEAAREYLKRRGLTERTAKHFSLGYASTGWTSLRDFLRRRRISLELGQQAGLVVAKNGEYYDRFRGRLIFPIVNGSGAVVAFGGRSLDDALPKYLNSPETPVYTKGKNLYGLFWTKEAIRAKDQVVLVEGYFDLLSLWNVGIENCVATLGTALTSPQVELLQRFTRNVVILFDADEAGQKAMRRSLELFLTTGMQARVLILPQGEDPDSFVRTHGKARLAAEIATAYPLVDYFIEEVIGRSTSFEDIREVAKEAVSLIAAVENPLEKDIFINRIAERLAVNRDTLKKEIKRLDRPPKREQDRRVETVPDNREDLPELRLIHIMLEHPTRIPGLYESGIFNCFGNEEARKLAELLYDASRQRGVNRFDPAFILDNVAEGPLRRRLMKLMLEPHPYAADSIEQALEDITLHIRNRWLKRRLQSLNRELQKAETCGNQEVCQRILAEKSRLIKEEREILLQRGNSSR